MKSLNNIEENNFITEDNHQKHIIKKYEFRNIDKKLEAEIAPAMEESGIYTPAEEMREIEGMGVLQEQIGRLLEENQKIFQKVSLLQEQLQQQGNPESVLEEVKTNAYQQGYTQGEKDLRAALEEEISNQKERMVFAIQGLEESAKHFQEQLDEISKDLSAIAIDLAKEVIIKEVEENHCKIALMIANELLQPLKNTEVVLRANPLDLPYLQEKISQDFKITFQADPLISKGGVLLTSALGNFDGSILSRYKNLKRNVLDEKGL